ncbi:ATP-dependent 6-phosphofructokinase 3-like [Camellia sinensis]|uniref:ATP-dependent 6-phosphofructokinase 3-like n=1 Tax=Camellia sinensis TaxID=4442 RepID=UPI001035D599|nr:ATP-dependent 6-phosphofructokinase 3-like [Camellia sinensis]XP_028051790.1 ATP-dependent 6-phosphofructokinase 3-like [Camellia sinensis]
MRFHFDRLSPSSLISLKLSLDRPRISGPPLSQVIDRSFGFDTAVEEAQQAINAAHVEAESVENGVGVVKLMGRYSGFIAMYATLASRDVDCCLIPESPFFLEVVVDVIDIGEHVLKLVNFVVWKCWKRQ